MFKSSTKTLVLALLVFVFGIGAAGSPSFMAVAVSIPLPTYPVANTLVTTDTPTLTWRASLPAASLDHYEYEVSVDSGFSSLADAGIVIGAQEITTVVLDRSKTYYWHVRACDNVSIPPDDCTAWSRTTYFRVSVEAPILLLPFDGDHLFTNQDTFEWFNVVNASGYNIQIATNSLFSPILIQQSVPATQTEFTPTSDLPANQILYWRVQASGGYYGPGPWSDTWSFTTANPPTVPELVQPKDGKLTTDFSPRLVWSEVTVPSGTFFDYYEIQIDTETDFSSFGLIDDITPFDPTITYYDVPDFLPLDPATTYYWRVRACNDDGFYTYCSSWPAYFTLKTSLDAPFLINPLDGDFLTNNRPVFEWTPVNKAISYTIQLSLDDTFTHPAYQFISGGTQYQSWQSLPSGVTYYWRVRGNHSVYGPGLWSVTNSFTTANPPQRPNPRSPRNSAMVTSITPTLQWTYSTTPPGTIFDYYEVQIDTDSTFGNFDPWYIAYIDGFVFDQSTPIFTDLDYPGTLNPITRYYWRVRACNMDLFANPACSDWSVIWNMRVSADAPINLDSSFYPFMTWDPVPGASSYYVEVYNAITGRLVRRALTTAPQVTIFPLPSGDYLWRVRVRTTYVPGYSPGPWSLEDPFTVP